MSYISSIALDEKSILRRTNEIDHERTVAINDLIEWNHFAIKNPAGEEIKGPYTITLGTSGDRITLTALSPAMKKPEIVKIATAPFHGTIRDYFLICESYFDAVKTGNLSRIEAIDMSRRGLHNEGAELLLNLTEGKIAMDSETARRFFTLICALHLK